MIQFLNNGLQAHTLSSAHQLRKFMCTSFSDITSEDGYREKALLEVNDNLNLHFYRFSSLRGLNRHLDYFLEKMGHSVCLTNNPKFCLKGY